MGFFDVLIPIGVCLLCLAGVVMLIALAYLFVVIAKTIKETMFKVDPMIDHCKEIVSDMRPVVKKIDPIMDRVTLTIDAANLEIMRVDQILEDVNTVTANVAKASNSVDTVTSVPLDAISSLTKKLRNRINSVATSQSGSTVGNVARKMDDSLTNFNTKVESMQAVNATKKAANDEAAAERQAAQDRADDTAANLKRGVYSHINSDTEFAE